MKQYETVFRVTLSGNVPWSSHLLMLHISISKPLLVSQSTNCKFSPNGSSWIPTASETWKSHNLSTWSSKYPNIQKHVWSCLTKTTSNDNKTDPNFSELLSTTHRKMSELQWHHRAAGFARFILDGQGQLGLHHWAQVPGKYPTCFWLSNWQVQCLTV